jgi:3-oxoacyl-[acyl-carrier protein] reductase
MGKLDGKAALVTGSGRNIGRATVLALAREGADVVVNARSNQSEAEAVAEEARALGVKAVVAIADVSDRAQVDRMLSKAVGELGKIDILINNAAIRPHKAFTDITWEDWELVRGIILDGPLYTSRQVLPSMVENGYGRIIFFTGDGSYRGGAGRAHISAAKTGLNGLARALAAEFAPNNIRVNVVSPGRIDTSRDLAWYPGSNMADPKGIPMARLGKPEEIAAACLFLVLDDCGYITGQTISVNGGTMFN